MYPTSSTAIPNDKPNPFPEGGDPWETCYSTVKKYDEDLCKGWMSEINNLIIFAGLFSATITAFLLQSYTKLSEDPAETTNWLLEQLLLEVHNANTGNVSNTAQLPSRPAFTPTPMDVRLNAVWFLSLGLSLATVVLAFLCIQWLGEYQRRVPLDSKDALSLRQIRYDGLIAWKFPSVLRSLPVLLHLSLILFWAGLIDLLWNLNHTVAVFVTVVSGIVLIIITVTTLLPGLQLLLMPSASIFGTQCPYKSPQAWSFHRFLTMIARLNILPKRLRQYSTFIKNKDWVDFDVAWSKMRKKVREQYLPREITDLGKVLAWITQHLGQSTNVMAAVYQCVKALPSLDGKQVVSQLSDKVQQHLDNGLIRADRLTEHGRQELLSLLFLEQQIRTFPQLDDLYFRLLTRFLSSQIREAGLTEEVNSQPATGHASPPIVVPFLHLVRFSLQDHPKDLVREYLRCLKVFALHGVLRANGFPDVWDWLEGILRPRATTKDVRAVEDTDLAQSACGVMSAIIQDSIQPTSNPATLTASPVAPSDKVYAEEEKVVSMENAADTQVEGQPTADPQVETIKLCAVGALQVFHSNRDFEHLKASISPIIASLEDQMKKHGGAESILGKVDGPRWLKLTGKMASYEGT